MDAFPSHPSGKANPGDTITYTVTINNSGTDASNLAFNDTIDANTTLVAGSVHASPLAFNDTYSWVGNTVLDTSARGLTSVTANDVAPTDAITLTAINGGATTLGGTVTLNSSTGHFVYTPPVGRPNAGDGNSVNDSFTYTIKNNMDASLMDTGTVTITLTGRVWYLQAGASGDGRSGSPSGDPAAMSTAADKSTDIFYVFSNASTLNGTFTLDNGQQLLGQGVGLTVNSINLFSSSTAPTIGTTAASTSAILIANAASATISGLNIGNTTASGIANGGANFGTLTVSNISDTGTGQVFNLNGGTLNASYTTLSSTSGANAINLVNVNGSITVSDSSSAISGATGDDIIMNGGNASFSYPGTITNTAGHSLNITNKTGGTVTFSGAISDTGTGILLDNNDLGSGGAQATINFTGGLNLSTGTNPAFTATNGGIVNATQNNSTIVNTLTTTTGTALNVANTNIGASGLTFRSINVTGNGSSPTSGIILNNTGTSGGLTVTGNSSGRCGGFVDTSTNPDTIIAANSADCTGGTIQSTGGNSIALTSTSKVNLTRVRVTNSAVDGINGSGVTDFTLSNCLITNNGNATTERGVEITNLLGANGSITNTTMSGNAEDNLFILNTSGTLSAFPVTGSTFTDVSASFGNDGIHFEGDVGSPNMSINVSSCKFDNNRGDHFQVTTDASNTAIMTALFQNNVLTGDGGVTQPNYGT